MLEVLSVISSIAAVGQLAGIGASARERSGLSIRVPLQSFTIDLGNGRSAMTKIQGTAQEHAAESAAGESAAGNVPTSDEVYDILRNVIDPELGSDIVDLGMVKGASVGEDGTATITIALTTMGCPLRAQIKQDAVLRVGELAGIADVKVDWTVLTSEEKAATMAKARQRIAESPPDTAVGLNTRVLLVASGKGGVGKSTVTVNLAAALAASGYSVGVLDADIWGFSVPRMLGLEGRLEGELVDDEAATEAGGEAALAGGGGAEAAIDAAIAGGADGGEGRLSGSKKKILPLEKPMPPGILKVVSMGLLVDREETALMWRGLILNRAVRHFLEDVLWGDLDYLLVDMPPGTGDVQMGIAKLLPRAEMIIVTTPSTTAQKVAARAATMGRKNYLRIVGVVENMTSFTSPDGATHNVFGEGGGEALAAEVGVPLLGQIPLDAAVAAAGDNGVPLAEGIAAEAFRSLADKMVTEAAPPMSGCTARLFASEAVPVSVRL